MSSKPSLDPRQAEFLKLYTNPKSETYNNIYKTAIKVGYSEEYAKSLRNQVTWISENIGDITKDELVKKSKQVLRKSLDSEDEKLAQDTAKFIAKTDPEFSEKSEHKHILPTPLLGGASVQENNSNRKVIESEQTD